MHIVQALPSSRNGLLKRIVANPVVAVVVWGAIGGVTFGELFIHFPKTMLVICTSIGCLLGIAESSMSGKNLHILGSGIVGLIIGLIVLGVSTLAANYHLPGLMFLGVSVAWMIKSQ